MKGDFLNNRIVAQNYFLQSHFLVPHKGIDVRIVEEQNLERKKNGTIGPGELIEVKVNNLPWNKIDCGSIRSDAFILNLEYPNMPFKQPSGCKAVEKAILFIKNNTLHVLLCEMKSELKFEQESKSGIGPNGVYKKIVDSITRVCTFLPVFANDLCFVEKIKFHTAIFFNTEAVAKHLSRPHTAAIVTAMDLYPAFQVRNNTHATIVITDSFGAIHPVDVAFIQNNPSGEYMTIDFTDLSKYFDW